MPINNTIRVADMKPDGIRSKRQAAPTTSLASILLWVWTSLGCCCYWGSLQGSRAVCCTSAGSFNRAYTHPETHLVCISPHLHSPACILTPPCTAGNGNSDHIGDKVALPPVIHLNDGVYEVGRTSPADIRLEVPTVSSRHALLRVGEVAEGVSCHSRRGEAVGQCSGGFRVFCGCVWGSFGM